jgi:flagellum-specific ATP synthase
LDGHTWLSRTLAARGHYPAIDVLSSISRLMYDITARPQQDAAAQVRELLAAYRDHEDLISIGAYRKGANRNVDAALEMREEFDRFLRQRIEEPVALADAAAALVELGQRAKAPLTAAATPVAGSVAGGPTVKTVT